MKSILAIDDSEINLELLKQVIKRYFPDFKFLGAKDGKEGIEVARSVKPEMIFLDIIMPEMNGYEVCKILKADKTMQNIPILMISALGQDVLERTKGLNAGADAFISKPFNHAELRAQIKVALRIKEVEDLLRKRNESLELIIKGQTSKYLESEERFLQISEHAREFYWEIDSNEVFIYVSPVIEKTLCITPIEIIGKKTYQELFQLNKDTGSESNNRIDFLNNKNFNDFEVELIVNKEVLWLSISGFSVFNEKNKLIGARGVCYDITKRKLAEIALNDNVAQIKEYQKKLKNLNSELTLVEEKERRRIAENLHDSMGQTLSLAYINLSSILEGNWPSDVKKTIKETSKLLDKAIKESRMLTYDLSPPILYELGLVPAIKWKLEQIEKKHGIVTKVIGERSKCLIPKESRIFIYRTVCELLNNVVKHSEANLVEVKIKRENEWCTILVCDNGIGFNLSRNNKVATQSGFGLLSIMERMESIKGLFEINSEPGKGTEAKISIPVSETVMSL